MNSALTESVLATEKTASEKLAVEHVSSKNKSAMAIIECRNVSKQYQRGSTKVNALSNVDLDIYPGEMLAIYGPSGSGKSTLLNIIGQLDKPTSGEITLFNKCSSQLKAIWS